MSFLRGTVRGVHHVGLPSWECDWRVIKEFWESLGLACRTHEVTDSDYDHAGAGLRLQVFVGSQLVVSYFLVKEDGIADEDRAGKFKAVMRNMHLALMMEPPALAAARGHTAFERETHWGHGNTSVFLTGPYGLHVELVTTNPDFHCDIA